MDEMEHLDSYMAEMGWSPIPTHLLNRIVYIDILSQIVGFESAVEIHDQIITHARAVYGPTTEAAFERALTSDLGSTVHLCRAGLGEAVIPCTTPIYQDIPAEVEATSYGAILLVFDEMLPLCSLGDLVLNLRKGDQWTQRGTQLRRVDSSKPNGYVMGDSPSDWEEKEGPYDPSVDLPHLVGMRGLMLSCIPLNREQKCRYSMDNNPVYSYWILKEETGLIGVDAEFTGIACPDEMKPVVVRCNLAQLYVLLCSNKVPIQTKIYSAFAGTYRFTAKRIKERCEVIDFQAASRMWSLAPPGNVETRAYQIAVSTIILGACYTIQENVAGQVAKRLSALRASFGADAVDSALITDFMTKSGYVCGIPNGDIADLIGVCVALVSATEVNVNALRSDLWPVIDVSNAFALDRFATALYTQLRLVAEGLQSVTIRFAIAAMIAFRMVESIAPESMIAQCNTLEKIKADILDRPYTGCCNPIPAKFTVANQAEMCMYGLLIYQKGLDEKNMAHFAKYKTDKVTEKVSEGMRPRVKQLVQETPEATIVVLVEFLEKLTLETAEMRYRALKPELQRTIYSVMVDSKRQSAIRMYLEDQERCSALTRVNSLLRERIEFQQSAQIKEISNHIEASDNQAEKQELIKRRNALKKIYSDLLAKCQMTSETWDAQVAPQDKKLQGTHYQAISALIDEIGRRNVLADEMID